jgi:hypothetical protein
VFAGQAWLKQMRGGFREVSYLLTYLVVPLTLPVRTANQMLESIGEKERTPLAQLFVRARMK